jgi:hypothetical protein
MKSPVLTVGIAEGDVIQADRNGSGVSTIMDVEGQRPRVPESVECMQGTPSG